MIFQSIPVAFPKRFATGDVYNLLKILCEAPEHGDLVLFNQDLAVSSPALIKPVFWVCGLTSFVPIWMLVTTKPFRSIRGSPTILGT